MFRTKQKLATHIAQKHAARPIYAAIVDNNECPFCHQRFATIEQTRAHTRKREHRVPKRCLPRLTCFDHQLLQPLWLTCTICGLQSANLGEHHKHVRSHVEGDSESDGSGELATSQPHGFHGRERQAKPQEDPRGRGRQGATTTTRASFQRKRQRRNREQPGGRSASPGIVQRQHAQSALGDGLGLLHQPARLVECSAPRPRGRAKLQQRGENAGQRTQLGSAASAHRSGFLRSTAVGPSSGNAATESAGP